MPWRFLLVLLVTSNHHELLNEDFIQKLITRHIKRYDDKVRRVDVIFAIVDRIPEVNWDSQPSLLEPNREPNVGSEGLSLAILNTLDAVPNLWSDSQNSLQQIHPESMQTGKITFSLKSEASRTSIELPLANSLFLNGRSSTLLAQRWNLSPTNEEKSCSMVEQKYLSEQQITMFYPSGTNSRSLPANLTSLLKPITQPRRICESLGNIVRTVFMGGTSQVMPASQELEAAIQASISSGKIEAQKAQIWALITPAETNDVAGHINLRTANISNNYLVSGSRLHKVLGGGGGWGTKQGLIALDPQLDYGAQESPPFLKLDEETGQSSEKTSFFMDIVKTGDHITFLVNDTKGVPAAKKIKDGSQLLHLGERTLQFGTLPPETDSKAKELRAKSSDQGPKSLTVHNHFGMLSRGGMNVLVSPTPCVLLIG